MDHGAERGGEELPRLDPDLVPVPELHQDRFALDGARDAVQDVVVRTVGIEGQGVDLVQVRGVVRGAPAQVTIEPADGTKGPAHPEVAVEVQRSRHGHVGLVVAGAPGEVRVADQDGAPGGGTLRRQRPGVRSGIRVRLGGGRGQTPPHLGRVRRAVPGPFLGPAPLPLQPLQEPTRAPGARSGDAERVDVAPVERRSDPGWEERRVQLDVTVHAGREPLEDVAGVGAYERVGLHRPVVAATAERVPIDGLGAGVPRPFAPGPDQPFHDVHAVVLELHPAHAVPGGPQILRLDVGHAVGRAPNHHLLGKVYGGALRGHLPAGGARRARGGQDGKSKGESPHRAIGHQELLVDAASRGTRSLLGPRNWPPRGGRVNGAAPGRCAGRSAFGQLVDGRAHRARDGGPTPGAIVVRHDYAHAFRDDFAR